MKLSTQRNRLDAPRTMRRLPPLYGAVGFQNRALVVQLVSRSTGVLHGPFTIGQGAPFAGTVRF